MLEQSGRYDVPLSHSFSEQKLFALFVEDLHARAHIVYVIPVSIKSPAFPRLSVLKVLRQFVKMK